MKVRKDYERLFKNINRLEPPEFLLGNILTAIEAKKRKTARIRLALFGTFALASLAALFPAIQYFIAEFSQSGFYQYFSLLFSDWNLAITYWNDFVLSLAEALPVLATAAVLSAIFVFLGSLRLAVKQIKFISSPIKLS
jgi:ABC-type multidrug transport system permease subunit